MELPTPPQALSALASYVRERLAEVSDTLAPLWERRAVDQDVRATARQLAMVIVGAAAPFAPTSYSRARLLRQLHASGLLTDEPVRRTRQLLEPDGAPR